MRMVDTVDGPTVTADRYELRLDSRRLAAAVVGADGRPWFRLRLLASVDTLGGPDETLAVESVSCEPMDDRVRIEVACSSSLWHSRRTYLDCFEDRLELDCEISGHGRISAVHLLGGWRPPNGFLPSGSAARTTFSPNPDHPRRIARPAGEPAVISVAGDGGEPGVGRWTFTPAPWCFAASLDTAPGPEEIPDGEWAGIGLLAAIEEQNFTSFHSPNPAFLDVTDVVRLNDALMLDAPDPIGPVVGQMAFRAAVVAASCPEVTVDTDGWCMPDRGEWAAYLRAQPDLGVPALYYATHIDHSGEPLRPEDLAEVGEIWGRYRKVAGLPDPGAIQSPP